MTYRGKLILVAVVAFLAGGVGGGIAGGYVGIYFVSRFFADSTVLGQSNDTQTHVTVLQHLRDGNTTKATEHLETVLDGNIISLSPTEGLSERTNQAVAKSIQKAKEYRSQYPRRTQYPEVDKGVSEILGLNAK